jgi:N-acetylglucosamine-6-phosphate deacetylase
MLIENGTICTPLNVVEDGAVLAKGTKISYVGERSKLEVPTNVTRIDASGCIVCPGFIDLQVNGGGGVFLTEDGSYEGVCIVAKTHAMFGTTSLLPTVITAETHKICTALGAVNEAVKKGTGGADVLGSHLEGPFINEKKKGAHDARFIRPPSITDFDKFWKYSDRTIKILTLAPEIDGSLSLIKHVRDLGVNVSVGHSMATYANMCAAVEAGLTLGTHIFNAMDGLGSREPGTTGAILSDDRIRTGLIADGISVHPTSMRIVIKTKGFERVFLVTDAMPPVGTVLTSFRLNDKTIRVKGGGCYAEDETITGSILSMNVAVRTIHERVGIPLNQAIAMATLIPAVAIGVTGKKGALIKGNDADIVVCNSKMQVMKTIVKGENVFESG